LRLLKLRNKSVNGAENKFIQRLYDDALLQHGAINSDRLAIFSANLEMRVAWASRHARKNL
jgi:hypothetical protein